MLSLREPEPGLPWAVVCGAGEGVSVSIDPNGNMTSDGVKTYVWDAENRLVEVKQGGNTLATFAYDGRGRRVEKVAGGITHRYVQDGILVAEERLSGGATGTTRYFLGLGIDEWLGRQNADSSTTYFMTDHLGSITTETSSAGAVTLARSYDAWGNLDAASAAISGAAFTGREWDGELELQYSRARYYDPSLGRFLSEDPSGLAGGINLFAYANNSPARFVDALGLSPASPQSSCHGKPCTNGEQAKADTLCERIQNDPRAPDCMKRGCPARVRCNTDPGTCTHYYPQYNRRLPNVAATHGPGDIHLCNGENRCETLVHELLHQCYDTEDVVEQMTKNIASKYCSGL